jgi:hypothetical protein
VCASAKSTVKVIDMTMMIETEFQSNKITLSFESTGNRVKLTREETAEFNKRMRQVQQEARDYPDYP